MNTQVLSIRKTVQTPALAALRAEHIFFTMPERTALTGEDDPFAAGCLAFGRLALVFLLGAWMVSRSSPQKMALAAEWYLRRTFTRTIRKMALALSVMLRILPFQHREPMGAWEASRIRLGAFPHRAALSSSQERFSGKCPTRKILPSKPSPHAGLTGLIPGGTKRPSLCLTHGGCRPGRIRTAAFPSHKIIFPGGKRLDNRHVFA